MALFTTILLRLGFAAAVFFALTAYAFHTAVVGRPLFKAGFLDAD